MKIKHPYLYVGIFSLVVLVIVFSLCDEGKKSENISDESVRTSVMSVKEATYYIDGKIVQLFDGYAETDNVPGSATKTITRYFGNELHTDLNSDGRDDVVFLLTQETGGSGTFFYVVAALTTEQGYVGSEGYFLGDRIAPQTTEMGPEGTIIVNFADRAPGESFDVSPSVGKSVYLVFDILAMQFTEEK